MTFAATLTLLTPLHTLEGLGWTYQSLAQQSSGRWQWVLICAADTPEAAEADVFARRDPRVTVAFVDQQTATARWLAAGLALTHAEFVAVLPSGDRLDPACVAAVPGGVGAADWAYTDEVGLGPQAEQVGYWYKTDFAPELLRSQPYTDRLGIVRTSVAVELGIDPDAGAAAWYDLALRLAESGRTAEHLVGPYYLRFPGRPLLDPATAADRCAAVAAHLARSGVPGTVTVKEVGGVQAGHRIDRELTATPLVSVVIPTAGSSSVVAGHRRVHVVEVVRQLVADGGYPELELVIVYDDRTPAAVLDQLDEITGGRWVGLCDPGEFNFSRKCNAGALAAHGELLCFLNDDIEVLDPRWLHTLVALLSADPQVAAVGPRLLFEGGALQHAGQAMRGGNPTHLLLGHPADTMELSGIAQVAGERSGLTAACLLIRRQAWAGVGGFSNELPVNFNDVDLCLKIRATGARLVYTPEATLRHFESQTRSGHIRPEEQAQIRARWGRTLYTDPYLNPLIREAGWLE